MANTRIRRKSISNKKRRNNKKKSVRRQKKVGGSQTCEGDITRCVLNPNKEENNIINVNALDRFVDSHPDCTTFTSSVRDDENEKKVIERQYLKKQISDINKERSNGYYKTANELTSKLVSEIPIIYASQKC